MESDIMLRLSYKPGLSNWTQRLFFVKTHLKKAIKDNKNPLLYFSFEKFIMK